MRSERERSYYDDRRNNHRKRRWELLRASPNERRALVKENASMKRLYARGLSSDRQYALGRTWHEAILALVYESRISLDELKAGLREMDLISPSWFERTISMGLPGKYCEGSWVIEDGYIRLTPYGRSEANRLKSRPYVEPEADPDPYPIARDELNASLQLYEPDNELV
jgi:hypothetical protein